MIYLCKSNRCNPDLVSTVRRQYEANEVLEHKGGAYNPELILKADKVIVVPAEEVNTTGTRFNVGKGQLNEIQSSLSKAQVIISKDLKIIGLADIEKIEIKDETSWTESAWIYIKEKATIINQEELLL
jgi:hypothetical protein